MCKNKTVKRSANYTLPNIGQDAIPLSHFPTRHQAFIFRAYEYVPVEKLAKILNTDVYTVRNAAKEMGLPDYDPKDTWFKKGYITIIRRMWHILPYKQLLELLDMDEETLARIMREYDFLDIKLSDKPFCEKIEWRSLTEEEERRTKEIKEIMEGLNFAGKKPFEFEYNVPTLQFEGEEWLEAKKRGIEIGAKVQVNTTWEASTVPAIPVSPSIEEHMRKLQCEGVNHLLLSWTLGGYLCNNIAAAAKYFYEKCSDTSKDFALYVAEKQFVKAFKAFPFHIEVLYKGPQNAGPSNLLFENPTGYKATMTCFAYDDVDSWRNIYPIDIFESQFEKLGNDWEIGLHMIPEENNSETAIMAKATYCLFKSSLNQIRFIRARNEKRFADAVIEAKNELDVAKEMLILMNKNAAIGYEAANHYYFSKGQIAEK